MRWYCTLDVADIWKKYPDCGPIEFLETLIQKFEELKPPAIAKDSKEPLLEKLKQLNIDVRQGAFDNEKESFDEEFNWVWGEIYDWADCFVKPDQKVCWVKTF